MTSLQKSLKTDVPTGWADVFIRTVKVALVAFVVLQMKEWVDAGALDTLGTATDALLIAAGTFGLEAVLRLVSS
jgi:hypothetical protein